MAASTKGVDRLTGILNLITSGSTLFKGDKTSSTASRSIPQEGLDALLTKILESNQGLAAVSSGQKTAGLYNSTVNTQLVNDLLSRSAGEVASRNETVRQQSVTPPKVNPLAGLLGIGGIVAGKKVLDPLVSRATDKLGLDEIGDELSNFIFGPQSSIPTSAINAANLTADPIQSLFDAGMLEGGANVAATTADAAGTSGAGTSGVDTAANLASASSIPAAAIEAANATADPIASLYEGGFLEGGADAATATGAASGGFDILQGIQVGPGSVPIIGPSIKLLGGDVKGAVKTAGGGYVGSAIGSAIAPGIGTAIGSVIGSLVGGSKCFLTTAMCKWAGRPDNCHELEVLRKYRDSYMMATDYRKELVKKYYDEAPLIVKKIDKLSDNDQQRIYGSIQTMIAEAVKYIETGSYEAALLTYTDLFNYAKDSAGE